MLKFCGIKGEQAEFRIVGENTFIKFNTSNPSYVNRTSVAREFSVHWLFIRNLLNNFPGLVDKKAACLRFVYEKIKKRKELIGLKDKSTFDGPTQQLLNLFNKEKRPHPYQLIATNFLERISRGILGDDVGLGKTLEALSALFYARLKDQKIDRTFIITESTTKHQWRNEMLDYFKSSVIKKEDIIIVSGTKAERAEQYKKGKYVIVNYELIWRDTKEIAKGMDGVDAVLLDEASRLKNRKTKTTKAARKLFKNVPIIIPITATPLENTIEDLYSLCEVSKADVFQNEYNFHRRYIKTKNITLRNGTTIPKIIGYRRLEEISMLMSGIFLRRTADEVGVQTPEVSVIDYYVELNKDQKKAYKEVSSEMIAHAENLNLSIPMVKMLRLSQICAHPQLIGCKGKSSKVTEIKRLLGDELKGKKVLLFHESAKFINILMDELKDFSPHKITGEIKPKDREYLKNAFNDPKMSQYNLLLANKAAEKGLSLSGGEIVINADIPYNPSRLRQRIGRIRRVDSKHKMIVAINIMAKDTVEEVRLEILQKKLKLFERIFNKSFKMTEAMDDTINSHLTSMLKKALRKTK